MFSKKGYRYHHHLSVDSNILKNNFNFEQQKKPAKQYQEKFPKPKVVNQGNISLLKIKIY